MNKNDKPTLRQKKTKIICTIGPSSAESDMLEKLIANGMDAARLNFSHGDFDFFERIIKKIRRISNDIAIIIDLPGPKIRTASQVNKEIYLRGGQTVFLASLSDKNKISDERSIVINYDNLSNDVKKDDLIFINDGRIKLKILNFESVQDRFLCEIIKGGILQAEKGVNFPNIALNVPSVTQNDLKAIDFGIMHNADMFAISFVRKMEDILYVRNYIKEKHKTDAFLISKIEKSEAVKNIEDIAGVSDGIMVARGDLGIETEVEGVALIQKLIISVSNRYKKPVITATQMLESMVEESSPTRAEVTDITNAILDGTDAVMLSEETAIGNNPDLSVYYMDKIAVATEKSRLFKDKLANLERGLNTKEADNVNGHIDVSLTIAKMATMASFSMKNSLVIAITRSGFTANLISSLKPIAPVIAVVPSYNILRKLALNSNVSPIVAPLVFDDIVKKLSRDDKHQISDEIKLGDIVKILKDNGILGNSDSPADKPSFDHLIFSGGIPLGEPGTTDFIRIVMQK